MSACIKLDEFRPVTVIRDPVTDIPRSRPDERSEERTVYRLLRRLLLSVSLARSLARSLAQSPFSRSYVERIICWM